MINDITEKGKLRASHEKQTHKMRAKQNSSNQSKKIYHYHLVLSGQNKYIAENIKGLHKRLHKRKRTKQ